MQKQELNSSPSSDFDTSASSSVSDSMELSTIMKKIKKLSIKLADVLTILMAKTF